MSFGQLLNKLNQRSTPLIPKNKFFRFSLFLVAILSLVIISKNTLAAPNSFIDKKNAIKTGNNQEAWLNEAMGSNMVSLFTGIVGDIPDEIFRDNSEISSSQDTYQYIPGGAFGALNKQIAILQSPPASGIEYIAQVRDNFLGKPAYAQGVGFQGLQFLLPLWRGFRNVIYIISTIIFIVIGVMIILRIKISPQAVITVQSAIPKLITTLILVTFSYAIAGLVIDLANFVQAFVVAIFFSMKDIPLGNNLFTEHVWGSGFPLVSDLIAAVNGVLTFFQDSFNFRHLANPDMNDIQALTYRAIPGWSSFMMLGALLGKIVIGFFATGITSYVGVGPGWVSDLVGWVAGDVVGGISGGVIGLLILPLILFILAIIWLIKLYFGIIKCYVTLIFKIVLGPLEIGMGAFPNSKMGFSTWIMDVISNMAVFPVIGIFLVLLNLICDALRVNGPDSRIWAPNLISGGGIDNEIISAVIGFAGLAILSKLPSLVPEFVFKIKPSPFGAAIGEQLSAVTQPFVAGGTQLTHDAVQSRYKTQKAAGGTPDRRAYVGQKFGNILEIMGKAKSN